VFYLQLRKAVCEGDTAFRDLEEG